MKSQNAEQLRQEFSANVSHELKTPLQGIIYNLCDNAIKYNVPGGQNVISLIDYSGFGEC